MIEWSILVPRRWPKRKNHRTQKDYRSQMISYIPRKPDSWQKQYSKMQLMQLIKTAAMRRFYQSLKKKKLFIKNPQVVLNLTLGLLQMKTEARVGFANVQKGYFITGMRTSSHIYTAFFKLWLSFDKL